VPEGTDCTCVTVGKTSFSRRSQKLTKAEERSGAPAPKGELSGECDSFGAAEALDQGARVDTLSESAHFLPGRDKQKQLSN
jgi:hypothetical protein